MLRGLGLRHVKETNVAFIAKVGWGLVTKKKNAHEPKWFDQSMAMAMPSFQEFHIRRQVPIYGKELKKGLACGWTRHFMECKDMGYNKF